VIQSFPLDEHRLLVKSSYSNNEKGLLQEDSNLHINLSYSMISRWLHQAGEDGIVPNPLVPRKNALGKIKSRYEKRFNFLKASDMLPLRSLFICDFSVCPSGKVDYLPKIDALEDLVWQSGDESVQPVFSLACNSVLSMTYEHLLQVSKGGDETRRTEKFHPIQGCCWGRYSVSFAPLRTERAL
jgi:hypothetical protein